MHHFVFAALVEEEHEVVPSFGVIFAVLPPVSALCCLAFRNISYNVLAFAFLNIIRRVMVFAMRSKLIYGIFFSLRRIETPLGDIYQGKISKL